LLSDSADDQSSAAGAQSAEMRVQEALGQLFQNMLPLSGRRESRQGSEVFLELSAGTFFGPGRTAFQPGRRVLLERLAVALSQAAASGVDFELQLFHSAGQGAAAASLATERTAAMAAELARQGVAPARLTVGLLPPDGRAAARVRIVLRVATAAAATGAPA
jgi:outer membrane protein OmpA-like peptidoglycan-associated protein